MARVGRPKADLVLSDEERVQLVRWARRRKSSQALALRSRIVLESATGAANTVVAERLGVSRPTVGKWRARFLEHRLDGLVDDPRPGRPATVTAEQVEEQRSNALFDKVRSTLEGAAYKRYDVFIDRLLDSGYTPTDIARLTFGTTP